MIIFNEKAATNSLAALKSLAMYEKIMTKIIEHIGMALVMFLKGYKYVTVYSATIANCITQLCIFRAEM